MPDEPGKQGDEGATSGSGDKGGKGGGDGADTPKTFEDAMRLVAKLTTQNEGYAKKLEGVGDLRTKLTKLEKAAEDKEAQDLADQGKFEQLAEQRKTENTTLQATVTRLERTNTLFKEIMALKETKYDRAGLMELAEMIDVQGGHKEPLEDVIKAAEAKIARFLPEGGGGGNGGEGGTKVNATPTQTLAGAGTPAGGTGAAQADIDALVALGRKAATEKTRQAHRAYMDKKNELTKAGVALPANLAALISSGLPTGTR